MSDPYLSLPPFGSGIDAPAMPDSAELEDTDLLDDEVEDDALVSEEPEDADEEPEGEEEDDEPDLAYLTERAKKADEYERQMARWQEQQKEQEVVAAWDQRLNEASQEFARREAVIYENAENSLNPSAYLKSELTKLNREAMSWYATYRDSREQALWQYAHQQSLPTIAARVAEHYKLPQEAIDELLEYPVEMMEREAQKIRTRLIKERTLQKQIDQQKRKQDQQKVAKKGIATGTGRGSTTKAGDSFESGYFNIPWGRGR